MTIDIINPATLAAPIGDLYAQVVVAQGSRRVYIAGQVTIDCEGRLVGEGDCAA
jgi:enamine deaminase RidA (YjgF/YER057c/UK114 family)